MPSRRVSGALAVALASVLALVAASAGQRTAPPVTATDAPVLDLVGQTGGVVGALAVQGDRVYAVVGTSLAVIDVSDAAAPRLVARSRPLDALITDLAVAGDRAYLATRDMIVALEVDAPDGPMVAATYRADGQFQILAADERHVYTIVSRDKVGAFQVLGPTMDGPLALIGEAALSSPLYEDAQMVVSGETVYVASAPMGILAIDVSMPTSPTLRGAYEDIKAKGIAVGRDRVYVVGHREKVVDRGQTQATALVVALSTLPGTYLSPDAAMELSASGNPDMPSYIAAWDRFVYLGVSGGSNLRLLDGQQRDALPGVGLVELPWNYVWYHSPKSIAVDRGRVFVAMNGTCGIDCHAYGRFNGVVSVDGTPPGAVTGAWLLDQPAEPWVVAAGAGSVAVGGGTMAIHFIETRSPKMPTFQGAIELEDLVFDLAAHGTRLVSSTNAQAKLIDFADPARPWLVEAVDIGRLRDLRAVAIGRDVVCAIGRDREADTEARLVVWDIGPDEHLTRRGELILGPWPDFTYVATIRDGLAYLASQATGLTIVDLGDPSRPSILGRVVLSAHGVALAGRYAYVTTAFPTPAEEKTKPRPRPYHGVAIVDVLDPRQPRIVGSYATFLDDFFGSRGRRWGVATLDQRVIVALNDTSLRVLDVADPTAPRLAQSIRVPTGAYDVAVAGDLAYVAAREGGLLVFRRHAAGGGERAGRVYLPFALGPRAARGSPPARSDRSRARGSPP